MWFENHLEDKPPLPASDADQDVWQQSDEEAEVTFRSHLFRGIHAAADLACEGKACDRCK